MGSWCLNVGGLWGCSWSQSTWRQPWWPHNSSTLWFLDEGLFHTNVDYTFYLVDQQHVIMYVLDVFSHLYLTCAILTFRTSPGDSQLPQHVSSSLTPSWSCSPWTKTWRWIMPYIWSNPVFQHSKISILSGDSNTSMFQHIPTYSNTPRNKRSLNPPIPDDPRCFFAQKSWHPTGGRAPGHASIARCWTPASQPAARRNSGGWRCTCCGSSWVFPDGKRRITMKITIWLFI